MAAQHHTPSPLFLREPEIRRGTELLFFGYSRLTRAIDQGLLISGMGRAHHRALYFVGRHPDISVSELLAILGITKQSLGRVLTELDQRGLIETRIGDRDRRQRLLRLTDAGYRLDASLFEEVKAVLTNAYSRAGPDAVAGFWAVLEGLIPEDERAKVEAWQATRTPPGGHRDGNAPPKRA